MLIENDILEEMKKFWPDKWQNVINFYESKEATFNNYPDDIKAKMKTPKEQLLERLEATKQLKEYELEVLSKTIPKDKLEDGVTYIGLDSTLSRHVDEARWDAKQDMFVYQRYKFGMTFEDTMHHFADVINISIAGFTPMSKK
jgi:hypothetical protein